MPHGFCLTWNPALLWLHILSNAAIALAYFLIPIGLLTLSRVRRYSLLSWFQVAFSVFIFSCGVTHLIDIVVLYHPLYWLQGLVLAFTALVSLFVASCLTAFLPSIIAALKNPVSREKLMDIHKELMTVLKDIGTRNESL